MVGGCWGKDGWGSGSDGEGGRRLGEWVDGKGGCKEVCRVGGGVALAAIVVDLLICSIEFARNDCGVYGGRGRVSKMKWGLGILCSRGWELGVGYRCS